MTVDYNAGCPRCFIENKPCARHCDPAACPDPAHAERIAEKDMTCQVCGHAAYTVNTYQGPRSWHRDATLNYSPIKGTGHRVIPPEEAKP